MVTLYGTGLTKGVAIAEAAVIRGAAAELPDGLVERGLIALRLGRPESELAGVVLVCESLDAALSITIPGTTIAGVALQSHAPDFPQSQIPCVAGVENLTQSLSAGDLLIVDATQGVVYVDPDARTLAQYQSLETSRKEKRVFIGWSHLPAVTQDGRTIYTYAALSDTNDIPDALAAGADGLVLSDKAIARLRPDDWPALLHTVAGKPLVLLSVPDDAALRHLAALAVPGQLCLAVREADDAVDGLRGSLRRVYDDLSHEHVDAAEIEIALLIDADTADTPTPPSDLQRIIIDAACPNNVLQDIVSACATQLETSLTVMLGPSINAIPDILAPPVDSIAVQATFIGDAKYLIRSLPPSEA